MTIKISKELAEGRRDFARQLALVELIDRTAQHERWKLRLSSENKTHFVFIANKKP